MRCTKVKSCIQCNKEFIIHGPAARYCSQACGQRYRYLHNMRTTDYQYSRRSGNWRMYFAVRVNEKGRAKTLTVDDLIDIYEQQQGKCALTGVEMTCIMVKGQRNPTNASVDRITAGGSYMKENVRLVCAAINRLRLDMPTEVFIEWCRKVVVHMGEKNG